MRFKLQRGFTLIELLVVIAIIGVLSSILMVNFIGVKARARDVQRKTSIRMIQAALEQYRADAGSYKDTSLPGCNASFEYTSGGSVTVYIKQMPCDPSLVTQPYFYNPESGVKPTKYCLRTCLENTGDQLTDVKRGFSDASCPTTPTACPSGAAYTITNP